MELVRMVDRMEDGVEPYSFVKPINTDQLLSKEEMRVREFEANISKQKRKLPART